jgi:hypothetical protein
MEPIDILCNKQEAGKNAIKLGDRLVRGIGPGA